MNSGSPILLAELHWPRYRVRIQELENWRPTQIIVSISLVVPPRKILQFFPSGLPFLVNFDAEDDDEHQENGIENVPNAES